ncbi:hypothetical protein LEMLEM_LOCUS4735, partial [Lemmus lemmus]
EVESAYEREKHNAQESFTKLNFPSALLIVSQSHPVFQLQTAEVGLLQLLGNSQAKMAMLIELMLFICM